MLLAYAQQPATIAPLREALAALGDDAGADDLAAAIDAIENGNANYFVDRTHSGNVILTIE
jgi:hypothetical protein